MQYFRGLRWYMHFKPTVSLLHFFWHASQEPAESASTLEEAWALCAWICR